MDTAQRYEFFAEYEVRGHSLCYERWCRGIACDTEVLELIEQLPPEKRQPNLVLGAARYVGSELSVYPDFKAWLTRHWAQVAEVASVRLLRRLLRTSRTRRGPLCLPAGSTLAIVGEHGAGKTTLVKLLCGLYQPTSGRITIDGTPLTSQARRSWHARTTATFQDFARFAFTTGESVGVGDLPHLDDPTRLADAIANGDAESVIATLPSGLHTQLGTINGGVDLSRGQWQRIALSRTHMRATPLLCVLDEPTASLDARSEDLVYRRQLHLAQHLAATSGTVTVLVSHRFSTVREADQIIVIEGVRITEHGTHDQLMSLEGHYAHLYQLQAAGYADVMMPVSDDQTR